MIPLVFLIRGDLMDDLEAVFAPSRTAVLLKHLSEVPDPRDPRRVAHPLPEVLLLVVCGTICDCDDYDAIAEWGEAHLPTLRRFLPYHFGVPCGRWLTILMNRLPPALFAQACVQRNMLQIVTIAGGFIMQSSLMALIFFK